MRRAYSASRGSSSTYDAVAIAVSRPPILPSIWIACGCWAITTAKRPSILISLNAELLRGPVSVLYGKAIPAARRLGQQAADHRALREIQFKMGTDSLFQTGFRFQRRAGRSGYLFYRLTGLTKDSDAQQNMSKEKRYAIAPSLAGVRMTKPTSRCWPTFKTIPIPVITAGCRSRAR